MHNRWRMGSGIGRLQAGVMLYSWTVWARLGWELDARVLDGSLGDGMGSPGLRKTIFGIIP